MDVTHRVRQQAVFSVIESHLFHHVADTTFGCIVCHGNELRVLTMLIDNRFVSKPCPGHNKRSGRLTAARLVITMNALAPLDSMSIGTKRRAILMVPRRLMSITRS
jgi:hypothetical protein